MRKFYIDNMAKKIKTIEDVQNEFQEKLRKEMGRDDVFVLWHTHHKTPPGFLRGGDPNTCTHFVDIEIANSKDRSYTLLLYSSLKSYLKKNCHFYLYKDYMIRHIICRINPTTDVHIYDL